NRHLPAWWEWADICLFTRQPDWTASQRKMMGKASRYHAARSLALAGLVAMVTLASLAITAKVVEHGKVTHAADLVQGLLTAEMANVPSIIANMSEYR